RRSSPSTTLPAPQGRESLASRRCWNLEQPPHVPLDISRGTSPMRYLALCTDYDGTIAHHGRVDDAAIAALERLRESGRKLVMVTGREIPDLESVFSRFDLFDVIVAENGALLYWPDSEEELLLTEPASVEFVEALRAKGVERMSVGRSI